MEIHITLNSHLSSKELVEIGVLAEQQGIHGLWYYSYLDGREPFSNMAALATATKTIRLGPAALNAYEQHPLRIAMGLLTFNEIAEGRAQASIGSGGEVVMALGIPLERRVRVARECLEFVKAASGQRPFSYDGELYQVTDYDPFWATAPAPVVYAAANRPQMLRMGAAIADGVSLGDLSPRLCREAIEIVNDTLNSVGRSPEGFQFNNNKAWYVYDDKDEARREAKRWIGYRAIFRDYMMEEFMGPEDFEIILAHIPQIYDMATKGTHAVDGVPDRLLDMCVDNLTLTGGMDDLETIIEHLHAYKQEGVTQVTLELRKHIDQSIKLIGERVIPALR